MLGRVGARRELAGDGGDGEPRRLRPSCADLPVDGAVEREREHHAPTSAASAMSTRVMRMARSASAVLTSDRGSRASRGARRARRRSSRTTVDVAHDGAPHRGLRGGHVLAAPRDLAQGRRQAGAARLVRPRDRSERAAHLVDLDCLVRPLERPVRVAESRASASPTAAPARRRVVRASRRDARRRRPGSRRRGSRRAPRWAPCSPRRSTVSESSASRILMGRVQPQRERDGHDEVPFARSARTPSLMSPIMKPFLPRRPRPRGTVVARGSLVLSRVTGSAVSLACLRERCARRRQPEARSTPAAMRSSGTRGRPPRA